MASGRVLALQARLDAARDKLDAELDKKAARDHNLVASFQERVKELHEELRMLTAPPGEYSAKKGRCAQLLPSHSVMASQAEMASLNCKS